MTALDDDARSVFLAALDVAPDQWAAYLDEACSQNDELRARVNQLLDAHQAMGSIHGGGESDRVATVDESQLSERPGTVVGPYKLLQQIGEGGMGVVFMAEQTEPIHRNVAVKIIKPGMNTRQVIARFEAERQALAMMDHQNIAKVLDAGATVTGHPYFVMELVKGVPITAYCDNKQLPLRERLELFVPVCHAVQHAHQKGIIHRDIKPTNVLVAEYDNHAVPKIIDFGVAKATAQKLTERTMFTEFGQVIGTVEYMSPEQAKFNQLDIDTRSDIYSLGVLLYELLTGSTPFERDRLREAAFDEVLRIIREEEPPRPSTRLSRSGLPSRTDSGESPARQAGPTSLASIAANRRAEPARLSKDVRGELDWIVMKCLEKDRNRRYETANGLVNDIARYLHDEPVQACPPSVAYRVRKFARRNRGLLLTAGLVIAALIVGTVVSVSQAVRATKAEALATARLSDATEARGVAEANAQKARQAVDDMYTQVAEKWLAQQPQMEPIQREFLDKALQFYTEFAKESSNDPAVRVETARAYGRVADIQHRFGEAGQAEKAYQSTIDQLQGLVTEFPDVPAYRQNLASTLHKFGVLLGDTGRRYSDAQKVHRRALVLEEQLAAEFPSVAEYRRDLGRGHWYLASDSGLNDTNLASQQRLRDKEKSLRSGLAIQESLANEYPAVPIYRQHLAETHLRLAIVIGHLGNPQEDQTHKRTAASILEKLVAELPTVPGYRNELANVYWWISGSPTTPAPEAEQFLQKALPQQEKLVADFPAVTDYRYDLFRTLSSLGIRLTSLDRPQEAEDAYRRAAVIGEKLVADAPGVDYYQSKLINVYSGLGWLFRKTGRLSEAELAYQQSSKLSDKFLAQFPNIASPNESIYAYLGFAQLLASSGRADAAKEQFANALQIAPENSNELIDVYLGLAHFEASSGRSETAKELYDKVLQLDPQNSPALNNLAWFLATCVDIKLRDAARAIQLAKKAVELKPEDGANWNTLGVAQYRAGEWQPAIESLNKSLELQKANEGFDWFFLAMAHWQLDHKDEARQWYDKAVEWMDKNQPKDEELIRFRAEAAELLGVTEPKPQPEPAPAPSDNPAPNDEDPTRLESPTKSGASSGSIPRQSGHAVEIRIVAGQMDETFRLHDGRHLRIAAEQPDLLTEDGRAQHVKNADRNYPHPKPRNFFDDLPEPRQFLHLRQIALQTIRDPRHRPAERIGCFDRHHPVRHVADRTGGCNPKNLAARNSFKQLLARPLERGMRSEMIDERVGIDEHAGAGRDICERHGDSQMLNSGSSATRSIVSASPFQPNKPALARTRLTRHSASSQTVTCTFSCSASGSGRSSLSTPFS
jgi:serine/threonine protein kinase/Tfp pilus assembly protein PilF